MDAHLYYMGAKAARIIIIKGAPLIKNKSL
jgi:hypothetical protein